MSDPKTPEIGQIPQSNFSLEEREVQLAIGENVKLSSMRVGKMDLFHGSPVPGIAEFKDAEETTVGSGIYLTSQRDAALGYSYVRTTDKKLTTPPIVYDCQIEDVNVLTLTTRTAIMDFMKYIRQELWRFRKEELPKRTDLDDNQRMWYNLGLIHVGEELDKAIKADRVLRPKDFLMTDGDAVREILMREGYDGIMAMEGGERGTNPFTGEPFSIGDHDSYVIFQPNKVKILKEELQKG